MAEDVPSANCERLRAFQQRQRRGMTANVAKGRFMPLPESARASLGLGYRETERGQQRPVFSVDGALPKRPLNSSKRPNNCRYYADIL
jgi:hypothetical protein